MCPNIAALDHGAGEALIAESMAAWGMITCDFFGAKAIITAS
jgi:hypothetical protein